MSETAAPAPPTGRTYLRVVAVAAAIGIPAALLAALFLALIHQLEHWLWDVLPEALGTSTPPWYLVVGLPVVGALIVLAARTLLPGDGGRTPLEGLSAAPMPLWFGCSTLFHNRVRLGSMHSPTRCTDGPTALLSFVASTG